MKHKEVLRLVRMAPAKIAKLHVGELSGRLNPIGQNLDIVELASVYGTHWGGQFMYRVTLLCFCLINKQKL